MNELIRKLSQRDIDVMANSTITKEHLRQKGLHLNFHGTSVLATNIISWIRSLLPRYDGLDFIKKCQI